MAKQFNEKFNTNFDNQSLETPEDLMTFKELCLKHGYKYDYIYNVVLIKGEVPVFDRGVWAVSEKALLEYSEKMKAKKLSEIKSRKGTN